MPNPAFRHFRPKFRAFARDERGNVAMKFGVSFLPMIFFAGVLLDYGNAVKARDHLRHATDTVTLAIAREASARAPEQLARDAATLLAAMTPRHPASIAAPPAVNAGGTRVCLETATTIDTLFLRFAGVPEVHVFASSCATGDATHFAIARAPDGDSPGLSMSGAGDTRAAPAPAPFLASSAGVGQKAQPARR